MKNFTEDMSAVVVTHALKPVGGFETPVAPPTFGVEYDARTHPTPYLITDTSFGGVQSNFCVFDTFASQANRLEPMYVELGVAPRLDIKYTKKSGESATVNILCVGHRLADACVRSSSGCAEVNAAFEAFKRGDALPLAKIAPTTLVFGAWDSRGTAAKVTRVLTSTIVARDVVPVLGASVYQPPFEYSKTVGLSDEAGENGSAAAGSGGGAEAAPGSKGGAEKNVMSEYGLLSALCTKGPKTFNTRYDGVLVKSVARTTIVSIAGIRRLRTTDRKLTETLQQYVYALACLAALFEQDYFLRSNCALVGDGDAAIKVVTTTGRDVTFSATVADLVAVAKKCAKDLGIDLETAREFLVTDPDIDNGVEAYKNRKKKAGKAKKAE